MPIKSIFLVLLFCTGLTLAQDATVDVGTFNIRFFPCNEDSAMMHRYDIEMRYPPSGVATDTTRLFQLIRDLDIEVLGVQELVDPALFGAMAKRHLGEKLYNQVYGGSKDE